MSLVNQNISLENVTTRYSHFQNVTKIPLYCDILQDALKNVSAVLVTLYF
jgi:hypothetical protein